MKDAYPLKFIQKDTPRSMRDAFDWCRIYSFLTSPDKTKYIVRAEFHEDVIAIKFYADKCKKSDNRYNLILNKNTYGGTMRILRTCIGLIPLLLKDYPSYSFIVKASHSIDLKHDKEENDSLNQRFRIYRTLFSKHIGDSTFKHIQYPDASVYLLLNKANPDLSGKEEAVKELFLERYDVSEKGI